MECIEALLSGILGSLDAITRASVLAKIIEGPVYATITTGMDKRDWSQEVKLMPRLRELILPWRSDDVALRMKRTERAVIAELVAARFDSLQSVRNE